MANRSGSRSIGLWSEVNSNFIYILIVSHCFSKFIWVEPKNTKSTEEVTRAFQTAFEESGRLSKNLQNDQGKYLL